MEYLGYLVDKEGLHATPGKVEAITKAPELRNLYELRSFLGLVNYMYYAKFIHHLSTTQPCTIPEHIMEVDKRVPAGISQSETTTSVLRSVSSLQSRPTAEAGLWRVSLLCWGQVVLCFLEWYWKANRLCREPSPRVKEDTYSWKKRHSLLGLESKCSISFYMADGSP